MFKNILPLLLLAVVGCNTIDKNAKNTIEEKQKRSLIDSLKIKNDKCLQEDTVSIDTLKLIVVQCANGYEYAIHSYNFNPVIERELNRFENIKVKPFPYKTLMGVSYQGVFDKKYCTPIIEKVDVDILVLTRFDNQYYEVNNSKMKWGYELRIVKTETLEQIHTISASGLDAYSEIEKHIQKNIEKLKKDIETLK